MSPPTLSRGRPRSTVPSYRLHKATGQAVVTVAGRDYYLGQHGTEESRRRYGELITRHAAGQPLQAAEMPQDDGGPTVDELCWVFRAFCKSHFVKHGKPTSEVCLVTMTIKPHPRHVRGGPRSWSPLTRDGILRATHLDGPGHEFHPLTDSGFREVLDGDRELCHP
jgi:hypothetical protein